MKFEVETTTVVRMEVDKATAMALTKLLGNMSSAKMQQVGMSEEEAEVAYSFWDKLHDALGGPLL